MFLFLVGSCFAGGPLSKLTQRLHPGTLLVGQTVQRRYGSSDDLSRRFETLAAKPTADSQSSDLSKILNLNQYGKVVLERLFEENRQLRDLLKTVDNSVVRSSPNENSSLSINKEAESSGDSAMDRSILDRSDSVVSSGLAAGGMAHSKSGTRQTDQQVSGDFSAMKTMYSTTTLGEKKPIHEANDSSLAGQKKSSFSAMETETENRSIDEIIRAADSRYSLTQQEAYLMMDMYVAFSKMVRMIINKDRDSLEKNNMKQGKNMLLREAKILPVL